MSQLPADYAERVYAGVLGKAIGVYLGRPFEGWTYEMIQARAAAAPPRSFPTMSTISVLVPQDPGEDDSIPGAGEVLIPAPAEPAPAAAER